MGKSFSKDITALHIEIFLEEPELTLRLYGFDADMREVHPDETIESFNDTIEGLWPVMTQDELDKFTVWEDDPKFGKTVALKQPIDSYNPMPVIVEWLRSNSKTFRDNSPIKMTYGIHDHAEPKAF